jgi:hypothetical protein
MTLFEGTFASTHASARVDLLIPVGVDRWDALEVKSSTSTNIRERKRHCAGLQRAEIFRHN